MLYIFRDVTRFTAALPRAAAALLRRAAVHPGDGVRRLAALPLLRGARAQADARAWPASAVRSRASSRTVSADAGASCSSSRAPWCSGGPARRRCTSPAVAAAPRSPCARRCGCCPTSCACSAVSPPTGPSRGRCAGAPARLLAYLALPIDLVPDVIPVAGYADDVLLVAFVLRSVVRRGRPGGARPPLARHARRPGRRAPPGRGRHRMNGVPSAGVSQVEGATRPPLPRTPTTPGRGHGLSPAPPPASRPRRAPGPRTGPPAARTCSTHHGLTVARRPDVGPNADQSHPLWSSTSPGRARRVRDAPTKTGHISFSTTPSPISAR